MSYRVHGFKDGTYLYAHELNEMDNAIALALSGQHDLTPIEIIKGHYINKDTFENASHDSFTINVYDVSSFSSVRVTCRLGTVALICWNTGGVRTQAGIGNSNEGINFNTTLTVPKGTEKLEVSYVTSLGCVVGIGTQETTETKLASQLKGKKLGLLGDSIAANGGFFNTLLSEVEASRGKNVAVGGWFYSEDTGVGNEYPDDTTKGIYRQIANLDGDEDVIIIWAGTNDFGHGHNIGELFTVDENKVRQPTTDLATLYGGFHNVVKKLYEKYTYIPIVVCIPLQRVIGSGNTYPVCSRDANQRGLYLNEYQDAIRKAAEFYSIPVFESGMMTNLDPHNQHIYDNYLPDGLHPNSAGHTIIGKALAKFINNNLYLPL